jgi:hypothetical protein
VKQQSPSRTLPNLTDMYEFLNQHRKEISALQGSEHYNLLLFRNFDVDDWKHLLVDSEIYNTENFVQKQTNKIKNSIKLSQNGRFGWGKTLTFSVCRDQSRYRIGTRPPMDDVAGATCSAIWG